VKNRRWTAWQIFLAYISKDTVIFSPGQLTFLVINHNGNSISKKIILVQHLWKMKQLYYTVTRHVCPSFTLIISNKNSLLIPSKSKWIKILLTQNHPIQLVTILEGKPSTVLHECAKYSCNTEGILRMLNLMYYSIICIKCLLILRKSKTCIRYHLCVKNFDTSFI
jgi:hypothetical protein